MCERACVRAYEQAWVGGWVGGKGRGVGGCVGRGGCVSLLKSSDRLGKPPLNMPSWEWTSSSTTASSDNDIWDAAGAWLGTCLVPHNCLEEDGVTFHFFWAILENQSVRTPSPGGGYVRLIISDIQFIKSE